MVYPFYHTMVDSITLAPYEEIDHYTYETLIKKFPDINYNKLSQYELEDNTEGKSEYACVGDKCDI